MSCLVFLGDLALGPSPILSLEYPVPKNNKMRHAETVEKYRSVWKDGEEWLPTREIEARLGMSKAIASNTLKKWADEYKIIERRPHGNVYNPCMGYEWRFTK